MKILTSGDAEDELDFSFDDENLFKDDEFESFENIFSYEYEFNDDEIFDFNKIFESLESYKTKEKEIKETLKKDYQSRKRLMKLVVSRAEDRLATLGEIFLNILLLRPYAEFGVIPTADDLYQGNTVTQDGLDAFFNQIIEKFRTAEKNVEYDKIRSSIADSMNEMCDLSGDYNVKVGNTVSYRDLIRLEVEDPEFDDITHTKIEAGQFNNIEEQFGKLGKRIMQYFKKHKDTELHPFVASETGINKKQFTQAIGWKFA